LSKGIWHKLNWHEVIALLRFTFKPYPMSALACKSLKFQKLRYGSRESPHSWQMTCMYIDAFGFPDWVTTPVEGRQKEL
jgi:hypothetical protein